MESGSETQPKVKGLKRFRITISTKLIGLIALLLVVSISAIVYQSTKMYVRNDKDNIQSSNVEMTETLAIQTREIFSAVTEKMRYLGTALLQDPANGARSPLFKDFFDNDKDFLAFIVYDNQAANGWSPLTRVLSSDYALTGDTDGSKAMQALSGDKAFSIDRLKKGEPQVSLLKVSDGSSAIALGIPLNGNFTGIGIIRPNNLSAVFSESSRGSSFLVDHLGGILSHTDATRVGENVAQLPVVKELLSGGKPQNLVPYIDPATRESRLASYRVVGFAGLGVVSELPEGLAYQAANTMAKRAALVGMITLFIAFWAGYMYSGTITRPITLLVEAAQRIASGDFKINLRAKGQDEIAQLSGAFNEMAKGLEERDRVKDTFNKFHNKEIAEKLLSGEVKLGGERKEATVFFSDVRGFTAMSESMEPEQVVEMLNEYMTRMVSVVRSYHGIVDKYVGDAIMALWGVPIGNEDDLYNAVRACLTMREELAKLNTLRISRGQSPLKIGMGLNIGPVIAGNIGSVEKMEYTVIGDTVNLASRMESMTKEYGTDFLVPQSIVDRVANKFIFEKCKSAKVKGKSNAIEIYKVKGYYDAAGQAVIIETPYSSYESEKSDKVVHEDVIVEENTGLIDRTYTSLKRSEIRAALVAAKSKDRDKKPIVFFVKMYNEVMGPFDEAEFRHGVKAKEFPGEALFSHSKDGPFSPVSESEVSKLIEAVSESVVPDFIIPESEPVTEPETTLSGFVLVPEEEPETAVATQPETKPAVEMAAVETPKARVVTPPPFRKPLAQQQPALEAAPSIFPPVIEEAPLSVMTEPATPIAVEPAPPLFEEAHLTIEPPALSPGTSEPEPPAFEAPAPTFEISTEAVPPPFPEEGTKGTAEEETQVAMPVLEDKPAA